MNEIATSYNRSLCNRIDIETSVLEELKDEIARFGDNSNFCFTDYDRQTVAFSEKKAQEAIECLKESFLNLKKLLR